MPNIIRETDEYVRYDVSMDDIVDATEQVEAAAEGYTDLDTRLDGMENEIDQAKQAIHFKGFVNYYDDLPNDAEENDAYTVLYSGTSGTDPDGTEYVYSSYSGSLSWNPWGKQTYSQSQIDTFLNAKQDTVTAGTGLAFGTGADANTLGHSNTVTAKATQGFAQIAYDAEGHITGSTAATTAQVNAINSGIDSTKVTQIETNKNNILLSEQMNGAKNLLEVTLTSGTESNQAIATVNVDKTITVNRPTANSSSSSFIIGKLQTENGKEYVVSGAPSGSASNTYRIVIEGLGYDYGSGYTFTGNGNRINIVAEIRPNVTVSNLVFKPMAITKDVYSAGFTDYQPYALSNAELTEEVTPLTSPISGGVTWASGYTPDTSEVRIRQYGNIVCGQVYAVFANALPVSAETTVGTITGVDKAGASLRLLVGVAPSALYGTPTGMAYGFISSSTGNIVLKTGASETGKAFCINFTYTTADPA